MERLLQIEFAFGSLADNRNVKERRRRSFSLVLVFRPRFFADATRKEITDATFRSGSRFRESDNLETSLSLSLSLSLFL